MNNLKLRWQKEKGKDAEIARLREAVAWAYQFVGAIQPDVIALDNLSALCQGLPAPHEWPIVRPKDPA